MFTRSITVQDINRENRRKVILRWGIGIFNPGNLTAADNPLSYVNSNDAYVDPVSRKVHKQPCSLAFRSNRAARRTNRMRSTVYTPLRRTIPWLLGTPYRFGDQPQLMSLGGIFPDNDEMLYNMSAQQLDQLELFYSRRFMWPRHRTFWEFITHAEFPEPERDPDPFPRSSPWTAERIARLLER